MTKAPLKNDIVDASTLDANFKYEVAARPGGEHITRCFACASCTLSCPVSEKTPAYSPRKFVHMILLGMKEEVLSSDLIWHCLNCYRCQVHCPQDVQFTRVMEVLRDLAVEQGYAPAELLPALEKIDAEMIEDRRKKIEELVAKKKTSQKK